jgi:pyruvate formate lyase activating enzyme
MRFGGFQPFTLSDYPGCVAAIAFTQGCNFRCPFCHNGALIPMQTAAAVEEQDILAILETRKGKLKGLVVSGGEPTIQPALPYFLKKVKAMGYQIKLDTNGSRPDVIAALIQASLVDYIAMDIKAPLEIYSTLTGVEANTRNIEESIATLSWSKIPHHFRTTNVTPLLTPADMKTIRLLAPAGSKHMVQPFNPKNAFDPALRDIAAIA